MQRSKAALVLAGGGVAGAAYEIGALCAIDELLEQHSVNEFDVYVGTSAGAIVGSALANGITPRTLLAVLEQPLLGMEQLKPQHLFSLKLSDVLRRAVRLPRAMIDAGRLLLTEGTNTSLLDVAEVLAIGFPNGLYDNSSLDGYLRQALEQVGRSNRFTDLERELYIIATDLDTGDRAVFGAPPLHQVPISKAVCASSALPIFYRPVRINDRDYIDGGLRGTASLDVAIESGAELIVCINPLVPFDNRTHGPGHSLSDEGLHRVGNQVFHTFVHAGLHYHLKQIRRYHPDVDIILIEPSRDDSLMFEDNAMRYQKRLILARHGFESVTAHLEAHRHFYEELLRRHGLRINSGRAKRTLARMQADKDDVAGIERALIPALAAHIAPAALAHTLSELDRVLDRIERRHAA